MSVDTLRIEKVHCNECRQETKHLVVATRKQRGAEEYTPDIEISWMTTYDMLECCGCESVCMRRSYWFSEDPEGEQVSFYPPPVSRNAPRWLGELQADLKSLVGEIYTALHADSSVGADGVACSHRCRHAEEGR